MSEGSSALFELEVPLPDSRLKAQAARLVGFQARYDKIHQDLRLLVDKDGLEQWSKKFYRGRIPLLGSLSDRYPLVVFHGDVGTGKTAIAEAVTNALSEELEKDAMLFKLSTRVRGRGNVGEMSTLINQAFDIVGKEAGRAKLSFLIIDEADSLAARRSGNQMHHEAKWQLTHSYKKLTTLGNSMAAFSSSYARTVTTRSTRRFSGALLTKKNSNGQMSNERLEMLPKFDCEGLGLDPSIIEELVRLTGPQGPHRIGSTFRGYSDKDSPGRPRQRHYPHSKNRSRGSRWCGF